MPGALRRTGLMAALFALVFAPGWAARSQVDADASRSSGRLAGAVLAPTLDQEELSSRRGSEQEPLVWAILAVVAAGAVALAGGLRRPERPVLVLRAVPRPLRLPLVPSRRGPPPTPRH